MTPISIIHWYSRYAFNMDLFVKQVHILRQANKKKISFDIKCGSKYRHSECKILNVSSSLFDNIKDSQIYTDSHDACNMDKSFLASWYLKTMMEERNKDNMWY